MQKVYTYICIQMRKEFFSLTVPRPLRTFIGYIFLKHQLRFRSSLLVPFLVSWREKNLLCPVTCKFFRKRQKNSVRNPNDTVTSKGTDLESGAGKQPFQRCKSGCHDNNQAKKCEAHKMLFCIHKFICCCCCCRVTADAAAVFCC